MARGSWVAGRSGHGSHQRPAAGEGEEKEWEWEERTPAAPLFVCRSSLRAASDLEFYIFPESDFSPRVLARIPRVD